MRSYWARLQLPRVPFTSRKGLWETESTLANNSSSRSFSSTANKMPAVHHKLLLEEALQDSPQTRSLLSVFEEDSGTLTDYTNQLLQSMQRVFGAQSEMGLATEQLSQQLLDYEKKVSEGATILGHVPVSLICSYCCGQPLSPR
ncbi:DCC-interacting protein 13-beta [Liparis tanakae]|uniref:DCC-interacting protein 13-beta n=1 Tax=Liparis tanakae TaxID=230148 RepID=A0A4Z2IEK6_9TELE|nr:DCC-interacting protein 13-beta [Liparis tanakae]